MPIDSILFNGETYPKFQSEGFAAKFAFPFADQVCKGIGVDVGCNRLEWALPSTDWRIVTKIDPLLGEYDALKFPRGITGAIDFVFSSHVLEHLNSWVDALNYWHTQLKPGGIVFLYLPDFSQKYWRPWQNRKHRHALTPAIVGGYFTDQPGKWKNTMISGVDLNNSFMIISEKV